MTHILKNLIKRIRFVFYKIKFLFIEKKHDGRLKYIYQDNGSDKLILVFSGFAKRVPKYNYMRTLENVKIDKLFILDDFGHRGSYYWYVDGSNTPLYLTNGLINDIKRRKRYKELMTAGSSKGGTCAIYFGLEHGAHEIFSGACQYHVGTYISTPNHRDVLEGMMGKDASKTDVEKLDAIMPLQLQKFAHAKTRIHLCFSKEEHTYQEHIVDLMADLKKYDIPYVEQIDSYASHTENGIYFSAYLKNFFEKEDKL
jgi:hypothetical protein